MAEASSSSSVPFSQKHHPLDMTSSSEPSVTMPELDTDEPKLTVRALFGRDPKQRPTCFDEYYWADLTDYARRQAMALGYNQTIWDDPESTGYYPPSMDLEWNELTDEQRRAMTYFGWLPDDVKEFDPESPDSHMLRVRRHVSDFVPKRGLVGDNQEMWNTLNSVEGRDILIQTTEAYQALLAHEHFGDYIRQFYKNKQEAMKSTLNNDVDVPAMEHPYYEWPSFGEQVIVEGMDSSQVCVGDVFQTSENGLMIEIASPRVACSGVDKKHKSVFGSKGIRRYSMVEGYAGWFVRVLRAGQLRDGDVLRRVEHPNPKWNLAFLTKAMFGEGRVVDALSNRVDWKRGISELEEVLNLEALAEHEWKIPARKACVKLLAEQPQGQTPSFASRAVLRHADLSAFIRMRLLAVLWQVLSQFFAPFTRTVREQPSSVLPVPTEMR